MTRSAALQGLATGLELMLQSVRQLLDAPDPDEWVDQDNSPLGRRRHLEAVRRGDLAGRKLHGQVLVRRRDIDAYIEGRGIRLAKAGPSEVDELAEIRNFRAPRRRKAG